MSELKLVDRAEPEESGNEAIRDGFGRALLKLGRTNSRVVALTADVAESTRANLFSEAFPERFIEVGVAEQNLAGIAAGLAHEGKIPFMTSFAVFSPGRNWDQIRVSICYSKNNVKIIGGHAGLLAGEDGATHQALEDIAITRVLPNMTVVVPCDAVEAYKATLAIAQLNGPCYLRVVREPTPVITDNETPFELGKIVSIKPGKDVTIIATGAMVAVALQAAKSLEKKISATVLNCHTIKPIDVSAIVSSAKKTGAVVTVEDHQIAGGLGGAVAEVLSERCPVPLVRVGVQDRFGESGKPLELLEHYGLGVKNIFQAVEQVIKLKQVRG